MKKWTYLITGIVIGAIVTTAGSAFADQVKSMIGKKVTGEYTVEVNGKTLSDKGAIIEGRTNVPVRGISEAMGADFKVEGKKIIIKSNTVKETEDGKASEPTTKPQTSTNKYMGGSKESLEELKSSIENNRIKPAEEGRKNIVAEIEELKKAGDDVPILAVKEMRLKEYDGIIANANEELRLVNEALAAIKN